MGIEPWLAAILGGGWLTTALAARMVLRGTLVPVSFHREAIAERDRQIERLIEDRDAWQEAHELSQRNYTPLAENSSTAVELGQTAIDILRAVQRG